MIATESQLSPKTSIPGLSYNNSIKHNQKLEVDIEVTLLEDASVKKKKPVTSDSLENLLTKYCGFISQLKGLIFDTHFLFKKFGDMQQGLSRDLALFQLLLEYSSNPENVILTNTLSFALYMFQEMLHATALLEDISGVWTVERYFLFSIVNLNIWLFTLHDNEGFLDLKVPNYRRKIINSWRTLSLWTEDFRELQAVAEDHRIVFETQRRKADETVDRLWLQIPEEGI